MSMLEYPGHNVGTATVTLGSVETNRNSTVVRSTQFGDPAVANCLNWHPAKGAYVISASGPISQIVDDFAFRSLPQSAIPGATTVDMAVVFSGLAAGGSAFRVEIVGIYEAVGTSITGLKKVFNSQADMDLIMNSFNNKSTSGWVGKPSEALTAYKTALTHTAEEGRHPEERKLPPKGDRDEIPWWQTAISIAKDVAGFMLA